VQDSETSPVHNIFLLPNIATNFYAPRALAQAGIEVSQYSPIITANDVSKGKPHADPYLAGARALNLDPRDCLVVEDAINGILSGKAAGAKTLGVATSSSKEIVAVATPDWVVQDLTCISVRWIDGKLEVTILDDE